MKVIVVAGLTWLALHLSGAGILVWQSDTATDPACTYLHSFGLHTAKPWSTGPCAKIQRF